MARQKAATGAHTGGLKKRQSKNETNHPDSSQWFRVLAELTSDSVIICDQFATVYYWNDAAERMFGYTRAEMIGSSAEVLVPERNREKNRIALRHILAQDPLPHNLPPIENYCVKKDGTELYVQFSHAVWQQEDRVFFGLVIRDLSRQQQEQERLALLVQERTKELSRAGLQLEQEIQGRQRAVELLRESEKRYRAVFENTGTAMIIFGDDTIITMANAEAERLSGYNRAEIEGKKSWTEFVHPEDLAKMQSYHAQRCESPASVPRSYEFRLIDRSGSVKNIFQTVSLIPGTRLRVASLVDITDRKNAEEQLDYQVRLLNTLLENLPVGVFMVEAPTGRPLVANEYARRLLGRDIMPEATKDNLANVYKAYRGTTDVLYPIEELPIVKGMYGEKAHVDDMRVVRPDGTEVMLEVFGAPVIDKTREVKASIVSFFDVTDRKRAEEERNRLIAILESTNDLVAIARRDYSLMYMNRAGRRMLGWDADISLDGKTIADVHPAWAHEFILREGIPAALRDGVWSGETAIVGVGGREIPVSHVIMAHRSAHGDVAYFSAIIRDISDIKRAEKALRESEERYRSVIETAFDAIITVDEAGMITSWNPAAEKLYGYSPHEAIGREFTLIIPERMHAMHRRLFAAVKEKKGLFYVPPAEGIGLHRNGYEFPVETSLSSWEVGGRRFFTTINRDITERKRTEKERVRLMTAIEQAFEAIVIMEPDGTVVYANPAASQLTGYRLDEIIGHNSLYPKTVSLDPVQFAALTDALRRKEIWTGRFTYRKKDGTLCEVEQTISPILDGDGNLTNILSIGRDISHEAALERQLRQAQKMESIGTLAGGIAHDFNNILAAIMGYTELSLGEVPEGSQLHQNLSKILASALRGRDLVRQILAFSRKSHEERHPLCLQETVREAVKLLRASIPTTIAIHEIYTAPDCMVFANPTQIHQVLINLCTNAAQAMQESGGTITISLRPAALSYEDAGDIHAPKPGCFVALEVSDTGPGIDPRIIDRIFDPFFTTKEVGHGTGMGLAVVHGIVTSYSGTIQACNLPEGGACFRVLLPCVEDRAPPAPEEHGEMPRGKERVLFIDDEELLVQVGTEMLRALGYEATGMQNSSEALELFRKDPYAFDLIITDHTMPEMTGYQLALNCISIRPDMPIILCTGYSETVSEDRALAAGIRGFLMKPVKLQELATSIRAVLASTGSQKSPC
ncbi:MAG: PAS domain S-box protein [Desulfobacterota bacterium]|nr:PAS domain S-box protein [Thermodesulfobacteriota bacterium]